MRKVLLPLVLVLGAVAYLVLSKTLSQPFEFAGTIEATRVDLPSRVATVVKSIAVEEGDPVHKDQVVTSLSCEDVILTQQLAEENYDRSVKLQETGSLSKEAFDLAQNKKLDADVRASWCEIKSPVDGTVLTRFLEPSEWVNPGTKILTVANLQDLWTYFYVPQEFASQLKVGTPVVGRIPELGREYNGKIVKINDEAEFTPKNVQTQAERTRLVFGVKVAFKNTDGTLKPGMTIQSSMLAKP